MVQNSSRATYYTISDGKVSLRHKEEVPGVTKSRTNKKGNLVHESFYDSITGRITAIAVRESEFGKDWNVTLQDSAGNTEVLQFQYSSGYSTAFLTTLPNADLSREVKLVPSLKIENDKKRTSLFIQQDGQWLKRKYKRDSGLPDLQQVRFQGKMVWDSSDQMEFLEKVVKDEILPKLKPASGAPAAAPASLATGNNGPQWSDQDNRTDDDQAPF